MSLTKCILHTGVIASVSAGLAISSVTHADSFAPYPNNLSAKLVSVDSASIISVSAETWPGFTRTFRISLTGIQVPIKSPDVKLCQRKLAEQALDFVNEYLNEATKIEIHNMTMQTSADQNAEGDIYTEKGSLSKALKNQGLARSTDIENKEPWC